MRRGLCRLILLLVAVWGICLASGATSGPGQQRPIEVRDRDSSLDSLLGYREREKLATALASKAYGGKKRAWQQFAAWGRELLIKGQVQDPPLGPGPSSLLAKEYRCVHCHNLAREDPRLGEQNPETREQMLRQAVAAQAKILSKQGDDPPLFLATGTTLWGVVNREQFYNGHYAKYHPLKLASGAVMNPQSLSDAVQICCKYCSGGRYPEEWELDSILAFLWELQIRLKDIGLPEKTEADILRGLKSDSAHERAAARAQVRRAYLRVASADVLEIPLATKGKNDVYAGGVVVEGSSQAGKFLYESACANCHGGGIHHKQGVDLVGSSRDFHRLVARGTERDGLYMPLFTKQRLSPRQLADIRAYLTALE